MELLRFDKKKEANRIDDAPTPKRRRQFDGTLMGDTVVIDDADQAKELHTCGFYGSFMDQKIPCALECFGGQSTSTAFGEKEPQSQDFDGQDVMDAQDLEMTESEREAELWRSRCPIETRLYLSMEESIFLADELKMLKIFSPKCQKLPTVVVWNRFLRAYGEAFVHRYAAYRFFRLQRWTVRSGLSFGADFVLYRESPEKYHASAGVRIVSNTGFLASDHFIALNREMTNVKKRLICVMVEVPAGTDVKSPDCINSIIVSQMTYRFRRTDDGQT